MESVGAASSQLHHEFLLNPKVHSRHLYVFESQVSFQPLNRAFGTAVVEGRCNPLEILATLICADHDRKIAPGALPIGIELAASALA